MLRQYQQQKLTTGMANLRYFDIKDVHVYTAKTCAAPGAVYTTETFDASGCV
jgi:hypothetical protein